MALAPLFPFGFQYVWLTAKSFAGAGQVLDPPLLMTKSVAVKFGSGGAFQNCVLYRKRQAPRNPAGFACSRANCSSTHSAWPCSVGGVLSSLLRPYSANMIGVPDGMPFWANHAGSCWVSQLRISEPALNGLVAKMMRSIQNAWPSALLSRIACQAGNMPPPAMPLWIP